MGAVSPEYVGRARLFLAPLRDADVATRAATEAIARKLEARWNRCRNFRADLLIDAEREWRERCPTVGRLGIETRFAEHGRALKIVEARVGYAQHRQTGWADGSRELNAALSINTLNASRRALKLDGEVLALVAHHSLGRFFERNRSHRDAESLLVADLMAILQASRRVLEAASRGESEFVVAAPSGQWRGEVVVSRDESTNESMTLMDIRTFVVEPVFSERTLIDAWEMCGAADIRPTG